jgi:hypothetical protein
MTARLNRGYAFKERPRGGSWRAPSSALEETHFTFQLHKSGVESTFPAASTARTRKVWVPFFSLP